MMLNSDGSGELKVGDRVEYRDPDDRRRRQRGILEIGRGEKWLVAISEDLKEWIHCNELKKIKSKKAASPKLICVQELAQAMPSPDCSSASTLLDSAKRSNTADTFLASDTPESKLLEISSATNGARKNSVQSSTLTLSQPPRLASPSQCKESDLEPMTSEIVSPPLSEPSKQSSLDSSQLRTSGDCSPVLIDPAMDREVTSVTCSCNFITAGMMRNGLWSEADTLQPPSLESDCFWLESPGALSSTGNGRPPGQSRLESFLKKKRLINGGEVLDPVILSGWFDIPKNWLDPSESRAATELLEAKEQQPEIFSILELPPLPSAESCTCHHFDGCEACGWFVTVPWNERQFWGDEPLDPDDVWRVGDRVQFKQGLRQLGTVRGIQYQELLGGKLPLIVVRWDGTVNDVLIPPEQLWRLWDSPELLAPAGKSRTNRAANRAPNNSPEPTRKRSPRGTRKYEGRCDKGQTNLSGRIERQVKCKKLSSGESKNYEYNLYRYQIGGVGKVYSKVIPPGKLAEVAEAIAAAHPAEIIVSWFWR